MSNLNQTSKDNRKKKAALGKGLGALIRQVPAAGGVEPASSAASPSSGVASSPDYFLCKLTRIKPCDTQPRKHFDPEALQELSNSIKESGLIQPLVVRKIEGDEDHYELIAGERRWRASKMAGLKEVPVVLKEVDDAVAFALALIENIQRQDLNPVEEALAYRRLMEEFDFKQAELAEQVGKSRAAVSNAMRLLQLPEDVLDLLADGSLSAGHARALLALDAEDASVMAELIVDQQLTVRDVEQKARSIKHGTLEVKDGAVTPTEAALTQEGEQIEQSAPLATDTELAREQPPVEVSFQATAGEQSDTSARDLHAPAASLREDQAVRTITEALSSTLGASRVRLQDRHGQGHIEIHYEDYGTLKRLLAALEIDADALDS